jgi:hypothetical protein
LQSYAPDGKAQEKCSKIYNGVIEDSDKVRVMLYAIFDGMNYGNWPWIVGY